MHRHMAHNGPQSQVSAQKESELSATQPNWAEAAQVGAAAQAGGMASPAHHPTRSVRCEKHKGWERRPPSVPGFRSQPPDQWGYYLDVQ